MWPSPHALRNTQQILLFFYCVLRFECVRRPGNEAINYVFRSSYGIFRSLGSRPSAVPGEFPSRCVSERGRPGTEARIIYCACATPLAPVTEMRAMRLIKCVLLCLVSLMSLAMIWDFASSFKPHYTEPFA